MCKNQGTRIEVLPTGEKVFYLDVSNIPVAEADEYVQRIRTKLGEDKKPDEVHYYVPIRSRPCECVNNYGITIKQLWTLLLSQIVVLTGFLLFWG
jgi:cobalamin biosynthesis Mg chelatase CobN